MSLISAVSAAGYSIGPAQAGGSARTAPMAAQPPPPPVAAADPDHDGDHDLPGHIDVRV